MTACDPLTCMPEPDTHTHKAVAQVTILCDGGQRHLSRFHNPEYLQEAGLMPTSTGPGLDFLQAAKVVPCKAEVSQGRLA